MSDEFNTVVSVVVPARNEEASLGACLESLVAQSGIDFEIIVVDDGSTDRTAEIARSFKADSDCFSPAGNGTTESRREHPAPMSDGTAEGRALPVGKARGREVSQVHSRPGVTVIPAPLLPADWTGKNNAMSAGAKVASGRWLLFTDADTAHRPGSLARAVAEAEQHGAVLLSYSPQQEVESFWEQAVMPVIFAELAATYPPQKVSDPASPIAAANGQYLLISRAAYDAVGGHAKIAGDLLEDVAMARMVKSSGRKILFRYGADAVRTRMYRSWSQMKEGWTKNLALLFRHPVRHAVMLLAFWVFAWIAFVFGVVAIASGYWKVGYSLLPMFFLYARIARANFRPVTNLITIVVGVPLTSYLLMRAAYMYRHGSVMWKGRTYPAVAA